MRRGVPFLSFVLLDSLTFLETSLLRDTKRRSWYAVLAAGTERKLVERRGREVESAVVRAILLAERIHKYMFLFSFQIRTMKLVYIVSLQL